MVIYEGPSLLDGAPIVAILTGIRSVSTNPKTGDMAQLWIMAQGLEPHTAARTGADVSVCGACPHRPANLGSCYVVLHQAPLAIYRGWQRGLYKKGDLKKILPRLRRKGLRLGAYGDPAALPIQVIKDLCDGVSVITGYTHQHERPECPDELKGYVMASCDNEAQARGAQARGWRTYRVKDAAAPRLPGEVLCPGSEERPEEKRLTCQECGYCDGNRKGKKGNVTITVHGTRARHFKTSLTMAV
jgi:hypothetical protein